MFRSGRRNRRSLIILFAVLLFVLCFTFIKSGGNRGRETPTRTAEDLLPLHVEEIVEPVELNQSVPINPEYYGKLSKTGMRQTHLELIPLVPNTKNKGKAVLDTALSALKRVSFDSPISYGNNSDTVHVALIFDRHRIQYGMQVIRSVEYYSKKPVEFHIVAPKSLYRHLSDELGSIRTHFYDYELCAKLVDPVLAFSNSNIHVSAHCKVFLSHILPVERVLYIDNDVTAVQDVSQCYNLDMSGGKMIGMGIDMGEVCQHHPNMCWPMAFEWKVAQGLVCGNAIERWSHMMRYADKSCRSSGQMEPVQFNGGVMLMDLNKMRRDNFIEKYIAVIVRTARITNFKKARWGEQEFMNSFFRVFPETLVQMPCGCNYQFTAIRREVKCPAQPVYLAHGWTSGVQSSNRNVYNQHFQHFLKRTNATKTAPPRPPLVSESFASLSLSSQVLPLHSPSCPHQSYDCSNKTFWDGGVYVNDTVYVITRTSGRPLFYQNARESVAEQSYPNVVHIVGTDELSSVRYIERRGPAVAESALFKSSLSNKRAFNAVDLTIYPSSYNGFNPNEICAKCAPKSLRQSPQSCASAPGLDKPKERDTFLRCFCNTSYPMNQYVNILHKRLPEPQNRTLFLETSLRTSGNAHVEPSGDFSGGWIIYLDDDNVFMSRHSIMEVMARVKSRAELVLWKSQLGRMTPSALHFGKAIVRGDVDASGFMYHSAFTNSSGWSDKRCGDYNTAARLQTHLPVNWVDLITIGAQPLRAKLGGLGLRADTSTMLTVVVQYDVDEAIHQQWLSHIVSAYLTQQQYTNIVDQVFIIAHDYASIMARWPKAIIVDANTQKIVSLANSSVNLLDAINTEAVLFMQNDVFVDKTGMTSMLAMWQKNNRQRLVGAFPLWVGQSLGGTDAAKQEWRIGGGLDDIMRSDKDNTFSFPSSRLMLVGKSVLEGYYSHAAPILARYFGETASSWMSNETARHRMLQRYFRDFALALYAIVSSHATPALLKLPEQTLYDFRDICDERLIQSVAYSGLTNEERLLLANPLTQPLFPVDPKHLSWLWTSFFTQIMHQRDVSAEVSPEKLQRELASAQVLLHPSKLTTGVSGRQGIILEQRTSISGFSQQAWKESFSTQVWCVDLFQ